MRDMQIHLDTLRKEAAECAMQAAETNDKGRHERLILAYKHLSSLADQVERAMAARPEMEVLSEDDDRTEEAKRGVEEYARGVRDFLEVLRRGYFN